MGMKKTPHQHGHRYTTAELRRLMELWAGGAEVGAIAEELKTTHAAILKQVQRMRSQGIPLERRTRGTSPGRGGRLWTQEEVEYLFRRKLQRATSEQIAADLGRTVNAVHGMIQKLRSDGVPVAMAGQGCKRLWDPVALKAAAAGRFDDAEIRSAEDIPN